jgi:hypothetical protein
MGEEVKGRRIEKGARRVGVHSNRVGVESSCKGGIVVRGWNRRAGVESSHGGVLVSQGCFCRVGVMWPSWLPFVWWHLVRQGGRDEGRAGGAHLCVIK